MNTDDLTIKEAKEISKMFGSGNVTTKTMPFKIGKKYLFRTVTHIDVGMVVDIVGDFVVIEQASWIADTGRFHDCLLNGSFGEIEPYPNQAFVNTSALVDAAPWDHVLPTSQK